MSNWVPNVHKKLGTAAGLCNLSAEETEAGGYLGCLPCLDNQRTPGSTGDPVYPQAKVTSGGSHPVATSVFHSARCPYVCAQNHAHNIIWGFGV